MDISVTDGLQALAASVLRSAAVYGSLLQQLQGPKKDIVRQLYQQQLETLHVLQGIYALATGRRMNVQTEQQALENIEPTLRRTYGQSLKNLAVYEKRSADGEFGVVFEALAVREREHCRKIAELMGLLQV